ncbi:type VII secretion target [Glycomyces paridis]|uniref:Uncharacterized protein n=1 Tax=Glycomyces paridis TaxID=2126555 RepID=A0A4S8P0L2_9ACTN|nr:type VII secretion target [Glycomyces paridis]THV23537.1 hypothetical protein E9998_22325 [Glycomyces paridis]
MSDRKHAEPEAIEEIAEAVRRAGDVTADAAAYAQEADPDLYMWGAVGLPLAYGYFEAVEHVHGILERLPGALAGLATRIDQAAKAIAASDEDSANEFNTLEDETGEGN